MVGKVTSGADFFERRCQGELLRVEAWSQDCIRVRLTLEQEPKPFDWTINPKAKGLDVAIKATDSEVVLRCGKLAVHMSEQAARGVAGFEAPLRFTDAKTGRTLLEERQTLRVYPDAGRELRAVEPGAVRAVARFAADPEEKFYGLGHNQYGFLNLKGCSIELLQMNTHTVVPVVYSSKGYGFFWNNPAAGRAELVNNGTTWIAEKTDQLDYFVFTGADPAAVMTNYARLTGFPTMMPDWAMGFWQCKLRYRTQDELLAVAREHKRRGLPMSVIVIDYFHWPMQGAWDFDPKCWPDPVGMLKELKSMGIETMVSIWPTVAGEHPQSLEMMDKALLVKADTGLPVFMRFVDTYSEVSYLHFVDFTNPEARRWVWETAKKNYYDRGVRLFWLDEAEPEYRPYHNHNARYHAGPGAKVSALYPLYEEMGFYEGMKAAGEELPINLCRSAWAGSQKYGACVWSGDIFSTFKVLGQQIKNGMNMAMAGIPWWTTDIGGFFGGAIADPEFRELVVRWFQWGVFCPVMRLHGVREPRVPNPGTGADNEVWSFGEEAYGIIKELLFLRERLRPYIKAQMKAAADTGVPPMRPLFFDYPGEKALYDIDDELLFGPDIVAAPVASYRTRSRRVYLPAGASWVDAWTGRAATGGQWLDVEAPLERIPVYVRKGAKVAEAFRG